MSAEGLSFVEWHSSDAVSAEVVCNQDIDHSEVRKEGPEIAVFATQCRAR